MYVYLRQELKSPTRAPSGAFQKGTLVALSAVQLCLYHLDDHKLGGGFKYFFIFTSTWGSDSIWLIFFRWAETTN